MKIGLIGLTGSGKTTLFNALTGSDVEILSYHPKSKPRIAVARVGDERVERLSALYNPRKTVFATVEFLDAAGVVGAEDVNRDDIVSEGMLKEVRNADALAAVVRNFGSDILGDASPHHDLLAIDDELLLSDLIITERRLERIEAGYRRGLRSAGVQAEEKLLRRIYEQLDKGSPIRELDFTGDEENLIRGFQFLTKKPEIAIVNSSEENYGNGNGLLDDIAERHRAVEFAGAFEMELSRLRPDEATMFMEDMGIKESAKDRLTRLAYEELGLISFFTVGEDEVRAWMLRRGATALEAAGVIHSDLARGFIAAECFTYDDLLRFGSEKAVKENGRFRIEGRRYVVQDGDILSIRFNV